MYKLEQKTKKRKNKREYETACRIHEMQEKWFKDAVITAETTLSSAEPQAETKIRQAFERYLKTQKLRERSTDDAISSYSYLNLKDLYFRLSPEVRMLWQQLPDLYNDMIKER